MSVWTLPLGVHFDSLPDIRSLGRHLSLSILPDPIFESFHGVRQHIPGQALILDGHFLSGAAEPSEYIVSHILSVSLGVNMSHKSTLILK